MMSEYAEILLYLEPGKWAHFEGFDLAPLSCNVYGHICPVYLNARAFTETVEQRRNGRHLSRSVMLKVFKRDGNICQGCGSTVPDNAMHFDHVIPHSRGGPTTASNLRVLCSRCNLSKGTDLEELLWRDKNTPFEQLKKMRRRGDSRPT